MSTWANSITISRLFFFALCIEELASSRPKSAIFFFLLAWGLDAIDGPIARYRNEVSVFGSQLDKVIDRTVLIGAVIFLLRYEYLPPMAIFLLVKDIGLSVAVTARKRGEPFTSAGWQGKAASVLQGVGILWLFAGLPYQQYVVAVVGVWGGLVAVDYLRRL